MGNGLVLLVVLLVGAVALWMWASSRAAGRAAVQLADAQADARRVIERLGGQVLNLTGSDDASRQALADAAERFTAASAQIDRADTTTQAQLAKQSALEGLYYVRAARTAMDMDPGPELESLSGQRGAGAVTEERVVEVDGHRIAASPRPSARTPNYYPGGQVAGRQIPAGWYSEPWWKTALIAGAWGIGSLVLFDALFSGMPGTGYEQGVSAGLDPDTEPGADPDGFDGEGLDGGWDFGGGDVGDFGDFGGF